MSFFYTARELLRLALNSPKIWLLPLFLFLVLVALITFGAALAPVPLFLYPLI